MNGTGKRQRGEALIGTSGFSYRHWRAGVFYPAKLRQDAELSFFSKHFRTVELNNPFYRLPTREALVSWRERTPADFRFAVKASRFIIHIKRLFGITRDTPVLSPARLGQF